MSSSALQNESLELPRFADGALSEMKLTLILDSAPVGVRASLFEEWEEVGRTVKMDPPGPASLIQRSRR